MLKLTTAMLSFNTRVPRPDLCAWGSAVCGRFMPVAKVVAPLYALTRDFLVDGVPGSVCQAQGLAGDSTCPGAYTYMDTLAALTWTH